MAAPERPRLGLRERKKEETRQRIVEVARRLFSERGYRATTVADIAAGAQTSVPTLFKYFASKEDIFFSNHDELRASWSQKLEERPGTANTIDILIAWMAEEGQEIIDSDRAWHAAYLRILKEEPELREARSKQMMRNQERLAVEIARDLDEPAQNLRPQILAAATVAALDAAWRSTRYTRAKAPKTPLDAIDYASAFLRAGSKALLKLPPPD
jgi:AcrR family transcriptional regulator